MTVACSVLLALAVSPAAPVPRVTDGQLANDVQAAREKAIAYLKKQQNAQGNREGVALKFLADIEGGETGFVALALLEGGVPATDPAIVKAVDYLAKLPAQKTYVVSLQIQVLARVDAKKHAKLIQRNVDWLLDKAVRTGNDLQGWSYPTNAVADGSNTHFAVVALHVAAKAGARVDAKVWEEIGAMYVRTQLKNGWSYHHTEQPRPTASNSMTAVALGGLLIVATHAKHPAELDKGIDSAWEAFERQAGTPPKSNAYMLHATAELGWLTGKRVFTVGKKEIRWYATGAAKLVKSQEPDGSWHFGPGIDRSDVYPTAAALYFLGPPRR